MLPEKFEERMQWMLGDEYPAFFACLEQSNHQSLRLNPLKGSREDFFRKNPFHLSPVAWEENGFYYDETDLPGKHPFHEAGVYYIQEASAMAPVGYLEAKPGEQVLDLCAAPGGKSTQIAAAMQGKGILVCNEIHPARAKILSENIERLGVRNALVLNETPDRLAERFPEYFDRILVDAPCSGEGMFRKNPEAIDEWSEENVRLCAIRQDEILNQAAGMLRSGGRLVYSTCTFAPAEDEGSVARFLERHPEFSVVAVKKMPGMEDGHAEWIEPEGAGASKDRTAAEIGEEADAVIPSDSRPGAEAAEIADRQAALSATIRLWPHKLSGEGHFLAVLQKSGSVPEGFRAGSRMGMEKGLSPKEYGGFIDFSKENLNVDPEGIYVKFGDQLYLAPPGTPSLKGLKVLRPGLHLGTMKKGRFEPSHALALTLSGQQAKRTFDLDAGGSEVRMWLSGMTLPAEGEKGWYLVTADGYSIGWGKLAGNVMKNHYPKGLRKIL